MLKAELKRLLRSRVFYVVLVLIVGMFVYLCAEYYNSFTSNTIRSGYGIKKYATADEVLSYIDEEEENLLEAYALLDDETLSAADRREVRLYISETETRINVYQYIIGNGIAYEDYRDYAGTYCVAADNAFSAFSRFCHSDGLLCFLPFIMGILAACMMPMDFHCGTYRILYANGTDRGTVIRTRYGAWALCALAASALCCLAAALLALCYGSAAGTLILANDEVVFSMNYIGVVAMESFDVIFRTLTAGTLVFGVSLFVKQVYAPLIVNVACLVPVFAYLGDYPSVNMLLQGIYYCFAGMGASIYHIFAYIALGIVLAAIVYLSGRIRFSSRDFG